MGMPDCPFPSPSPSPRMNKSSVEHQQTPITHNFYFRSHLSSNKKSIKSTNAIDLFLFLRVSQSVQQTIPSTQLIARRNHEESTEITFRCPDRQSNARIKPKRFLDSLHHMNFFNFNHFLFSLWPILQERWKTCVVCMQANIELVIACFLLSWRTRRSWRARANVCPRSCIGVERSSLASPLLGMRRLNVAVCHSNGARAITWYDTENEWTITTHKSSCLQSDVAGKCVRNVVDRRDDRMHRLADNLFCFFFSNIYSILTI